MSPSSYHLTRPVSSNPSPNVPAATALAAVRKRRPPSIPSTATRACRRRRRTSGPGWAYVPTGSRLEARLRRLFQPLAESKVRAAMNTQTNINNINNNTNADKLEEPTGFSQSQSQLPSQIDNQPLATPDEWKLPDPPPLSQDTLEVQTTTVPMPLPSGSQMSEGLEILLLASQESIDFGIGTGVKQESDGSGK